MTIAEKLVIITEKIKAVYNSGQKNEYNRFWDAYQNNGNICVGLSMFSGYNWNDEIIVTVGGSEAIDIGIRALVNDGDEIIIPQPAYVSYEPCALLANAKPVIINLKAENDFRLTAEELKAAL